jgi:prepilin-type N-terminal cleavage/methylation domain-containing protein
MHRNHKQQGFTLVELTIVVVILGILATFAVPRFRTAVEKTKASEGLGYLHQVELQQERFMAIHGRYARSRTELASGTGESVDVPEFFAIRPFHSSDWERRWNTKLVRNGASSGFGRYRIAWGNDGFMSQSTIPEELLPAGYGN